MYVCMQFIVNVSILNTNIAINKYRQDGSNTIIKILRFMYREMKNEIF